MANKAMTAAQRQAQLREKRKAQGFERVNVYVHENDRKEFDAFVESLKKPPGSEFRGVNLTR